VQFKSGYKRSGLASARMAVFCLRPAVLAFAGSLGVGSLGVGSLGVGSLGLIAPACAANAGAQQGSAQPANSSAAPSPATQKPAAAVARFDIDDFAVEGADKLPEIDIEEAIYPFLGPNKSAEDVEKARTALEKAYHDKGYQTVSVAVPQQNVRLKVVVLKVTELKVGRLRVKSARYFDLEKIKQGAPSLKEGSVPSFGEVTKDIVALNQWPDRRVTPALRAGSAPGTVDVDLNVEDKPPIHASVEVNNRQSPNTTAPRVSATVHYDNLWQLGHSFSFTYQVAPQRPGDAEVYSASYLARLPQVDWLSLMVYGVKSSSNVATVGGTSIVGPGQIVGGRAVMTLPARENLFHTLSVGVDYKHFDQTVALGTGSFGSPVTYYPIVATYGATFQTENFTTQLNAGLTYNLRPFSGLREEFDNKRFAASTSFTHFNLDVSHTQELPEGFQVYGKIQGQLADGPLVSSEQLSAGGLDTVRGYLESETLGDDGIIGNLEFRSPNLGEILQKQMKDETGQGTPRYTTFNEWRMFTFADAGRVTIQRPLAEQDSQFDLWSYGVGSRFKMFNVFNGMLALSVPMTSRRASHRHRRDRRTGYRHRNRLGRGESDGQFRRHAGCRFDHQCRGRYLDILRCRSDRGGRNREPDRDHRRRGYQNQRVDRCQRHGAADDGWHRPAVFRRRGRRGGAQRRCKQWYRGPERHIRHQHGPRLQGGPTLARPRFRRCERLFRGAGLQRKAGADRAQRRSFGWQCDGP
jgi:hemolysin activation/secretion protein